MEEEKETIKSSLGSEKKTRKSASGSESKKKKRRKSLFEWSKEEELNLLKKLVEFDTKKMAREELYPFLRNGSALGEMSKIQIFNKIQQLKKEYLEKKLELRKKGMQYLKLEDDDDEKRDESFEISNRLWGEVETGSASTCKALDVCSRSYFEGYFEGHGLDIQLFTPSFIDATNKDVDRLFSLQNYHILIKAKLQAQLAQLKYDIIQARINNPTIQ